MLEKEGFQMKNEIDLLQVDAESVHEIKKNMPNLELFIEQIRDLVVSFQEEDVISIIRFNIAHFKQVNDIYGFEVGDRRLSHQLNVCKKLAKQASIPCA